MWKIVVAFIVFAAVAIGVLVFLGDDSLDMSGEKHGALPAAVSTVA